MRGPVCASSERTCPPRPSRRVPDEAHVWTTYFSCHSMSGDLASSRGDFDPSFSYLRPPF